jgi:predicted DNA-binding transcriptional regulator YafY
MRASRLLELLVRLQVRGGASATELADEFDVSVRTIYRDVEALCTAGVPIYTETGRNGGIRIDPSYRVAGLPTIDNDEARGMLFAAVPSIAAQLGFDATAADSTLLPAMERDTESAARVVRERLLIEPTHWFIEPDDTPALADIAGAVWDAREVRITYRGTDAVVQPLGLILKGHNWYVLGRSAAPGASDGRRANRLYRVSRIEAVEVLRHRFERPPAFDLAAAWATQRRAFLDGLPQYLATVRVAPGAEPLLALLDEAAPELPLPEDTERDGDGWAVLHLRFERTEAGVARHLFRLGAGVEVLGPPTLRALMTRTARDLARLYSTGPLTP